MSIVYLTGVAEDRCRREIEYAEMVGEVYGDYDAETRLRDRAIKRLEPYRKVWWHKESKQDEAK